MKKKWVVCILTVGILIGIGYCLHAMAQERPHSVTVYFSLSDDGEFVMGNDKNCTVLARVPVTIEYFDLAEYGLEAYYRYEADAFENGGEYIGTEVIEQPTVLHLLIKMLEEYYIAGEKLEIGTDAMSISGSATHLFMTKFWGHDCNLLYYLNHEYPLQAEGLGATSDYLLLEDGMEIEVGMFTDWSFYSYGVFAHFDQSELNLASDETAALQMLGTNMLSKGQVTMGNEQLKYSTDGGYTWKALGSTDKDGYYTVSFHEEGTYYLSAGPVYNGFVIPDSDNPCVVPPIAILHVSDEYKKPETSKEPETQPETNTKVPETPAETTKAAKASETTKSSNAATVKVPKKPTLKSAKATGTYQQIQIRWKQSDGAKGYYVYRKKGAKGSYKKIAAIKSASTVSYTDKKAVCGTTYYYTVKAYNQKGTSSYNQTGLKAITYVPDTVKLKSVTAGKKKATVKWKKAAGASGYEIYRAAKKNGKYQKIKTTTKVKYINTKLQKGKTYYYKIRSYKKIKGKKVYGKYSNIKSVKCKK